MFNQLSKLILHSNKNKQLNIYLLKTICSLNTKQVFSRSLLIPSFNQRKNNEQKNAGHKILYALPFFFTLPTLLAKEREQSDEEQETIFSNENQKKKFSRRDNFNFIADTVEQVLPSIVQIEMIQNTFFGLGVSSGSGFIVSSDGVILTNAHVVRDPNTQIYVKLNDGKKFIGQILKIDRSSDIAIIKINCDNLKAAKLGDSDKVRTGEFVIALGSPLTLNNTVTSGVVSNPSRDGTELGLNNELLYIQTDTIVTHGNSGGPLVNLDGEVIGINSMTATPGISFAIPAKYAIEFLETKKQTIGSKYHYVGMKMVSLTPQIHSIFRMQSGSDIKLPPHIKSGCLIVEVAPNSPAERAGLKRGDIILSANDINVQKNSDLLRILNKTRELYLTIYRDGVEINLEVTADEKA